MSKMALFRKFGSEHSSEQLQLFWVSFAGLVLELLIVRWFSAEIRAFSVLKAFPLATCFIGLGVGFLQADKAPHMRLAWYLLLAVGMVQVMSLTDFSLAVFPSSVSFNWNDAIAGDLTYLLLFMLNLTAVLAMPFMASFVLGARQGYYFAMLPPLNAYLINLAGAGLGTLAFVLTAHLGWSPAAQLLLLWPECLRFTHSGQKKILQSCLLGAAIIIAGQNFSGATTISLWSPYQYLELQRLTLKEAVSNMPVEWGWSLCTNHGAYQSAVCLSPDFLRTLNADQQQEALASVGCRKNLPFILFPSTSILILGSGMGNDIAAAKRHNIKHVTAVEIDPLILSLGKELHPEKPYADPAVLALCDDARHYLNTSKEKFDLILYPHLDSHTALGASNATRLDNYVYTKEALESALRHLKSDGFLVLSFCTHKPWFTRRLASTLAAAAGYTPLIFEDSRSSIANTYFVLGEKIKSGSFKLPDLPYLQKIKVDSTAGDMLTDDYPFLYLKPLNFDFGYLAICAEVLFLAFIFARDAIRKEANITNWQMFFLGAGFMLLEFQAIARLAVVFGATWQTSGAIVLSVLAVLAIATACAIKLKSKLTATINYVYFAHLILLANSFFLPISYYLALDGMGAVLLTLLTILPIYSSGLIFSYALSKCINVKSAMAFNLAGATVGALLEYISSYTGINSLLVLAAAMYGIAFCLVKNSSQYR